MPCNAYPCKGMEFTASNLKEGRAYEFRVRAVNEAGAGEASEASEARKAELPVVVASKMGAPRVGEVTRESVVVAWARPASDGNARVEGYVIEKRSGGGEWSEVGEVGPKELEATVTNVVEGKLFVWLSDCEGPVHI